MKRKKEIVIFLCMILLLCSIPTLAYASDGIGITTEFDGLEGDGKYLGQEYRGNYKLDSEKIGITNIVSQTLYSRANVIFYAIKFLGFGTAAIFYYSMNFDLAGLLQPQINTIQETLHDSVFTPLFQFAFLGAVTLAIMKYARRDFMGLITQFGKVCFIIVLSLLVVRDSAKFLSYATAVTKSVSVSILTGVSGTDVGDNVDNYAKNAAAVLWISLVHEPWKTLEFGDYAYSEDDVEFFLTVSDEEERQERVTEMAEEKKGPFKKDCNVQRYAQALVILLTILVKCVVYVIVGVMYFLFQVVAVFFVIMAPLILLLSLIPGYDFEILGVWARKILETQIGVLLITFLLGMMIFCDEALQGLSNTIGWFTVLILQIAACVFLYLFRWQILMSINNVHRGIQNPRLLKRQFIREGNPYGMLERQYMLKYVRSAMGNHHMGNQPYQYRQGGNSPGFVNQRRESGGRSLNKANAGPASGDKMKRPNTKADKTSPVQYSYSENSGMNPEGSGIKGETYYAPREVTENWRNLWDQAQSTDRPLTSSGHINRRPVLSQAVGRSEEAYSSFSGQERPTIDGTYTPINGTGFIHRHIEPKITASELHGQGTQIERGKIPPAYVNLLREIPQDTSGNKVSDAVRPDSNPSDKAARSTTEAATEGKKPKPNSPGNKNKEKRASRSSVEQTNTKGRSAKEQGVTYNSSQVKSPETSGQKMNGSSRHGEVKRPETVKEGSQQEKEKKKVTNKSAPAQKEKKNINVRPVTQPHPGNAENRNENSKPRSSKPAKTPPKVPNAAQNSLKPYKGSSTQAADKKQLKRP